MATWMITIIAATRRRRSPLCTLLEATRAPEQQQNVRPSPPFVDTHHNLCDPAPPRCVIWLCHGALLLAQASFVMGAVYFRAIMQHLPPDVAAAVSPLKFVFCRCALATPILLIAAATMTGHWTPHRQHMPRIALLGLFLFLNQGLFIVGLQHAGALLASCLQPAIPTFTHVLAVALGLERCTWMGSAGVVMAMLGAACMVRVAAWPYKRARMSAQTLRNAGASNATHPTGTTFGIYCLLGNTAAMAAYIVTAKQLQPRYARSCVATDRLLLPCSVNVHTATPRSR